ncbi:MAG: RNA polymerase sigma factor [Planctomycetota bacterium]
MQDRLLVLRCRQGNKEALRRIYEKYRDYLLILAVALSHDVNLGEDAVHDVFVSFAERQDKFELTGSLRAYLATCVANRTRDLMRRRQNKDLCLDQDCWAVSPSPEPGRRIIYNEQLQQLSSVLSELPYEQREVIALRIYGQMRFRAIARSLDVSVNTVRGRYRYGINKLRSILNIEADK